MDTDRGLDDPHAIAGEYVLEDSRELAVAVADEELVATRGRTL